MWRAPKTKRTVFENKVEQQKRVIALLRVYLIL